MLAALVQPYPPSGLHRGRLYCGVAVFQPVPESVVVRICEVSVGIALEGGDVVRDVGQLAGYVLGDVGVVPGPGVLVLAHPPNTRPTASLRSTSELTGYG